MCYTRELTLTLLSESVFLVSFSSTGLLYISIRDIRLCSFQLESLSFVIAPSV